MVDVVLDGGAHNIEVFLTASLGVLRYDQGNDSLRVHDGVKEGGYEFLNRDSNDGRYQARSLELDGFSFGAQEKGILCRIGPANYKIRRITVLDGSLTVVNPRGTSGDIDLALSAIVPTDHQWDGLHTFTQPVTGSGGFVGNVTGDLTGDSFGTHNGPSIGTHTGATIGSHTGDVDVSGANFVTDVGQILETQIDPQAWIRRGLPLGAIVMWSGLVVDIPSSFALCDGNNGTPDLRDRFVLGAGNTYDPGDVGGTPNHTHTGTIANSGAHQHNVTVGDHALTIAEIPAHKHGNGIVDNLAEHYNHGTLAASPAGTRRVDGSGGSAPLEGYTTTDGGGATHTHAGSTTDNSGAHNHTITLDDAILLPPYYALCFIMKIV